MYYIGRGVQHLHFPLMHQGYSLSHGHGLNLVMGHINKGLMVHLMDFHQLLPGPLPQLGIQVGKRFV